MNKKIIIIILCVLSFFVYKNYFSDSDNNKIRLVIAEIESDLEYQNILSPMQVLKRLKRIESKFTPDLKARYLSSKYERNGDVNNIQEGAVAASRIFQTIDIFNLPARIEIKGKQASAKFHSTITGRDKSNEEFKELFEMSIEFKLIDDKWKCFSINAKRLLD